MSSNHTQPPIDPPRPGCHEVWVTFQCGAKYPLFSLKKYVLGLKRKCPVCGARKHSVLYACVDCGVIFELANYMARTTRCKKCQRAFKRSQQRALRKQNPKKRGRRPLTEDEKLGTLPEIMPKYDCKYYTEKCLPAAASKNAKAVDCRNCRRYKKIELHATYDAMRGAATIEKTFNFFAP